MRFEWDPDKDVLNRAKHGVGFEEAMELFTTRRRPWLEVDDDAHGGDEIRCRAIGTIQ